MATYLITGGAGFIGSHAAEALIARGDRVIVIDDLSSGSLDNIAGLRENPSFRFVPENVMTPGVVEDLAAASDVIIHLAATVGVSNIIDDPVQTILNNINGTEAVLQAALRTKRKVLIASTSEVYGKSTAVPFREDDDVVLGPSTRFRWSYAASKLADEYLALAYWNQKKLPAIVTRFFNTIGPRQSGRYGMVVPRFLAQALNGENLTVHGTGRQSRCFTYVTDIVEWMLRLIGDDRAFGQVFNLGNPGEITIARLAGEIIRITGSSSSIEFQPHEEVHGSGFEDIERRVPSIEKVAAITGYFPRVELEESLRRTHQWFLETGAWRGAARLAV